jgi:hypothetical protein
LAAVMFFVPTRQDRLFALCAWCFGGVLRIVQEIRVRRELPAGSLQ